MIWKTTDDFLFHPMSHSAGTCPLCGAPNDCQLSTTSGYKGECWCMKEDFPEKLMERVPEEARRVACICRRCVVIARRAEAKVRPVPHPKAGDFYIEGEHVVFTAQYHQCRGYCCGSGCRHCPYDGLERELAFKTTAG